MFSVIVLLASCLFFFIPQLADAAPTTLHFFHPTFNKHTRVSLRGQAKLKEKENMLMLSNEEHRGASYVFYSHQIGFKNSSNSSANSFSTSFVFAIDRGNKHGKGGGLAFVIAPEPYLNGSENPRYLGIFNESNFQSGLSNVFAVELDTQKDEDLYDIDENHVGIDIGSVVSRNACSAKCPNASNLDLANSDKRHVSINYDGISKLIKVNVSDFPGERNKQGKQGDDGDDGEDGDDGDDGEDGDDGGKGNSEPSPTCHVLLTASYDLSNILTEDMYVGFSTTSGFSYTYLMGWSFAINRKAKELKTCEIQKVPKKPLFVPIWVEVVSPVALLLILCFAVLSYRIHQNLRFAEMIEGWEGELNYTSQRYKYKDLYTATKGFNKMELLGEGGFGEVYRGVMPYSNAEIALKRISHDSRQGMKEFVAEIVSLGRLRHRNLVPLLGYCRRKGELLLVYEYMSNGSLDKLLHGEPSFNLTWDQRFQVIKGVAYGLLYLHEEWEQVVIHRDIKPGNVLLDADLNPRLGDFGLARLHAHGSDPSTTNIVGTLGYLAPEHANTGRATKSSDVFAFGALMLEVASGRRPIQPNAPDGEMTLADWVHSLWTKNQILDAVDPRLGRDYRKDEAALVLKLGLMCNHARPDIRPIIRDIAGYLEDPATFPKDECDQVLNLWVYGEHGDYDSMMASSTFHTGNLTISHSLFLGGR